MQSERDRLRAAVAGPQQPDPMVGRIKAYTDQGYSEQDARFFISQIDQAVQPLQQQNQQLQAAVQGQNMAQQAYQQAVEANPELFQDPKIQQATWNAMQNAALNGDLRFVNAEQARIFAAQEYSLLNEPWKRPSGTPPAPPQPFRPMGVQQFGGNGSSYAPNAQQTQQQPEDPAVQAMADRMSMRAFGKPLSQVNQPQ